MSLPESDTAYLVERGIPHEVIAEAGMTCVLFPNWPLPGGFSVQSATLMLRLSAGYPDVHPDMWWFEPAVHLENGQALPATEVIEQCLGRTWQRWSRHLAGGQWQSGIDGLESYLALIRSDLERCVPQQVAS